MNNFTGRCQSSTSSTSRSSVSSEATNNPVPDPAFPERNLPANLYLARCRLVSV